MSQATAYRVTILSLPSSENFIEKGLLGIQSFEWLTERRGAPKPTSWCCRGRISRDCQIGISRVGRRVMHPRAYKLELSCIELPPPHLFSSHNSFHKSISIKLCLPRKKSLLVAWVRTVLKSVPWDLARWVRGGTDCQPYCCSRSSFRHRSLLWKDRRCSSLQGSYICRRPWYDFLGLRRYLRHQCVAHPSHRSEMLI